MRNINLNNPEVLCATRIIGHNPNYSYNLYHGKARSNKLFRTNHDFVLRFISTTNKNSSNIGHAYRLFSLKIGTNCGHALSKTSFKVMS